MEQRPPSLTAFERHVASRNHDAAVNEALRILAAIDNDAGVLAGIELGVPAPEATLRDLHIRFATRFSAALGTMLTQPDIAIGPRSVELLFAFHHWIAMIFEVSGFQTSAHLLDLLSNGTDGGWRLEGAALVKFLMIFSPASYLELSLDELYAADPDATTLAALGYLSARCVVTARADAFRERLLEWIVGRVQNAVVGQSFLSFVCGVYMHCSYAATPAKHRIKGELIAQMRKAVLRAGAREMTDAPPRRARPRIVVVAEQFRGGHSVYRTHSRAVRALREHFEVIGVGYDNLTDEYARTCFDDLIFFPGTELFGGIVSVAEAIRARSPDIIFYLGVGMSSHAIGLASLRLAPVQCASYGHTATTMSPVIDYMVLPDDFVGSEACFSERVLRLPSQAFPYAPPVTGEGAVPPRTPVTEIEREVMRIAVPASIMKVNASFLAALVEISERASRPVQFVFFPLGAQGLAHRYLEQEVLRILPGAVVHPFTARALYLERLGACAFFLSPFPYGNMNSIVDAMLMGVPGICRDGEEAHSHADVAIFRRLGLPEALCAADRDAYVETALRLIDNADWRAHCRQIACNVELDKCFYNGDEKLFCDAMLALVAGSSQG